MTTSVIRVENLFDSGRIAIWMHFTHSDLSLRA